VPRTVIDELVTPESASTHTRRTMEFVVFPFTLHTVSDDNDLKLRGMSLFSSGAKRTVTAADSKHSDHSGLWTGVRAPIAMTDLLGLACAARGGLWIAQQRCRICLCIRHITRSFLLSTSENAGRCDLGYHSLDPFRSGS